MTTCVLPPRSIQLPPRLFYAAPTASQILVEASVSHRDHHGTNGEVVVSREYPVSPNNWIQIQAKMGRFDMKMDGEGG